MAERTLSTDYYADLGISSNATAAQIKSAFRSLAKLHHPDKKGPGHDGDTSAFRRVREAYEKLSDPQFRAEYDRSERSTLGHTLRTAGTYTASEFSEFETRSTRSVPTSPYRRTSANPFATHFRSNSTPQATSTTYPKAHGVRVLNTRHSATSHERCPCHIDSWILEIGKSYCIFCMLQSDDTWKCPGCAAVACGSCSKIIQGKAEDNSGARPKHAQYRPSGG